MSAKPREWSGALRRLAGRHGVQVAYASVRTGTLVPTPPATLVAVLRALGAPLERAEDAPEALRAFEAAAAERVAEPAAVAWDGEPPAIPLRLPRKAAAHPVRFELSLEAGGVRRWEARGSVRKVRLAGPLPPGVHRLRVAWRGGEHTVHVLAAPRRLPGLGRRDRRWGVFLPLFAARSENGVWGGGTLTDLRRLLHWTAGCGGSMVSTLPLFATYLDAPFDPSPYAPVSRLFWNEFYLDPNDMEEFHASPEAKRIVSAAGPGLAALGRAPLFDWRATMALRRKVLATLAEETHLRHGGPPKEMAAYAAEEPELDAYARFRATTETIGAGWRSWPAAPPSPDPTAVRYHRWVQWRFERALGEAAGGAKRRGVGLYLDLPLGVHGEGFDPWRWPDLFADGVAGGAPPDHYSARGQDWGFPPLHPERVRADGHRYLRSCVRRLARHASVLRLDHVMSLHRLWWVPSGAEASAGAYVRYPSEELYAVVCLEASRAGLTLVGEDLGTVPSEVRSSLRRHGWHRTWAVQRALVNDPERAFSDIPAGAVASFNTHDHPSFAGWWSEADLEDRVRLGFLDAAGLRRERARRARAHTALMTITSSRGAARDGPRLWFRRALPVLGACRADMVLVNLEDLWGEPRPQNVPGTTRERPNWRRRARRSIDQITRSAAVRDALGALDRARRTKEAP